MVPELTAVNRYRLIGAADALREALAALVRRVEAEGEPGVVSYRFFVDEAEAEARAVVDYATPAAWMGHHRIAMDWPEMAAMHRVARLDEVVLLGNVTDEIIAWLDASSLRATLSAGHRAVAGFVRQRETGR